jgi:hypothetical protein
MFQFPALALTRLYIQRAVMPNYRHCVSAFRNLRINACLPASRSLSQAAASFFASRCQDIHRTPLVSLTPWIEDRHHASSTFFRRSHLRVSTFSLRKVYFANRCSSDACPTERPSKIIPSRHRRSHFMLIRTSYLIVKELASATRQLLDSSHNDPPSAGECIVCGQKRRRTYPGFATSELFTLLGVFVTG